MANGKPLRRSNDRRLSRVFPSLGMGIASFNSTEEYGKRQG